MTRAEIKAHAFRIAVLRGWKPPPDRKSVKRVLSEAQREFIAHRAVRQKHILPNPMTGLVR